MAAIWTHLYITSSWFCSLFQPFSVLVSDCDNVISAPVILLKTFSSVLVSVLYILLLNNTNLLGMSSLSSVLRWCFNIIVCSQVKQLYLLVYMFVVLCIRICVCDDNYIQIFICPFRLHYNILIKGPTNFTNVMFSGFWMALLSQISLVIQYSWIMWQKQIVVLTTVQRQALIFRLLLIQPSLRSQVCIIK